MKILIYIICITALGLSTYNATQLDFNNLFVGNSSTALIGIMASLCVLLLMGILLISKKIEKKHK